MFITLDWLNEKGACSAGKNWFVEKFPEGGEYQEVLNALAEECGADDNVGLDWGDWLIKRAGSVNTILAVQGDLVSDCNIFCAGAIRVTGSISAKSRLVAGKSISTVGGINSSTYGFWQNIVQSAAAPLQGGSGITPSASTIESLMLPLWIKLTRGMDTPNLIVMSDDYFTFFEQSQTSLKRYTADQDGQAGMLSMKYKTADVFFDSSGGIPAAHAYFLNTKYMDLVVHQDANITMLDDVESINQDALVKSIIWQGNLALSNRSLQGVLKA